MNRSLKFEDEYQSAYLEAEAVIDRIGKEFGLGPMPLHEYEKAIVLGIEEMRARYHTDVDGAISSKLKAEDEAQRLRRDVEVAAGELRVDIAEAAPGSTVRRLLIANRLMRHELDMARRAVINAVRTRRQLVVALSIYKRGMRIIEKVMDYTLDGRVAEHRRHVWILNSIIGLRHGKEVVEPKRGLRAGYE